jgi:hypothetical protein
MIPVGKVVTIFFKTFSGHLIKFAKLHTRHRLFFLRGGIIWIGNRLHTLDHQINKKFSDSLTKSNGKGYIKALPDDKAFDNGFNFLLEVVLLYGIILAISIHEVNKGIAEKAHEKEQINFIKQNAVSAHQEISLINQLWKDMVGISQKNLELLESHNAHLKKDHEDFNDILANQKRSDEYLTIFQHEINSLKSELTKTV